MSAPVDVARHAEMLANRVRKNQRKVGKRLLREGIEAYRLYDRDIPEVRAVVDRYADHLVVAEFEREQTAAIHDYVEMLGRAAGEALGLEAANVHVRRRRTGKARGYGRAVSDARVAVNERELKFWVELEGQLDTGLFGDHRETRHEVGQRAAGKRVLNLFAYTGSFTCWAAHGGARETLTVDATARYADWAEDNLRLNDLAGPAHRVLTADVARFLQADHGLFDLVVVDPPSRSSRYGEGTFDVLRDHPELLRVVRTHLAPKGVVYFSSNHQRFMPRLSGLPYANIEEITERTVPADYRNRTVHRAFLLQS
ncbi:MAG: class I SAM-dependent methyltransferase [Sandaracinaceae bacterium]